MPKHILRIGLLALAGIVASSGAEIPAHGAEGPKKPTHDVDLHEHPTNGAMPVEVSVGLYVTNLVSIDETRESFEVGGYLMAKWKDPRLALPADGKGGPTASSAPRPLKV